MKNKETQNKKISRVRVRIAESDTSCLKNNLLTSLSTATSDFTPTHPTKTTPPPHTTVIVIPDTTTTAVPGKNTDPSTNEKISSRNFFGEKQIAKEKQKTWTQEFLDHQQMDTISSALSSNWTVLPGKEIRTALDSGCTRSVFNRVANKRKCKVKLQGIGSTTNIEYTGNKGSINDALEHTDTPINLVSLGQILDQGPWTKIIFEVDKVHSANLPPTHTVTGVYIDVHEIEQTKTLAYRNTSTNGLYQCTDCIVNVPDDAKGARAFTLQHHEIIKAFMCHVTSPYAYTLPESTTAFSTQHTYEIDPVLNQVRILGHCSEKTLKHLQKHGYIKLSDADIKRYSRMSREARLIGGMTKPPYTNTTGRGNDTNLQYLEELQADSKQLTHPGKDGEKYSFDIVDRATGTEFTIPHRDFKELPKLIERWVVQVTDDAKRRNILDDPKIRRIRLDGHSTQLSIHPNTITEVEEKLIAHDIATNPVAPGLSRQMGRVGASQKNKARVATNVFHDQGHGIPSWGYLKAYMYASGIKGIRDFIPQSGYEGKSSFELREGRPWKPEDLPRPLFSTAYFKHMSATGMKNKMGCSGIGILVGQRPDINAHEIWEPKSNKFFTRAGCIFNERFSSYKNSRIADMRAGRQIHKMSDTTNPERVTRNSSITKAKLHLEPVKENGKIKYFLAKMNGEPVEQPFCCPDKSCKYSGPMNGLKTLGGLMRHLKAKAKRVLAMQEALLETTGAKDDDPGGAQDATDTPDKNTTTAPDAEHTDKNTTTAPDAEHTGGAQDATDTPDKNTTTAPDAEHTDKNTTTAPDAEHTGGAPDAANIPDNPSTVTTPTPTPLNANLPKRTKNNTTKRKINRQKTSKKKQTKHTNVVLRRSTRIAIAKQAIASHLAACAKLNDFTRHATAFSLIPFDSSSQDVRDIAMQAITNGAVTDKNGEPWQTDAEIQLERQSKAKTASAYNVRYDVYKREKKRHKEPVSWDTHFRHYQNRNKRNKTKSCDTYYIKPTYESDVYERDTESPEQIQAKYDSIPYTQDPSPQWDPTIPHETIRAFLGIEDPDTTLFDDTCTQYRTPDVLSTAWEVEGYRTDFSTVKTDKHGRPILTLENADMWTPKFVHEIKNNPYRQELYDSMTKEVDTLNKYKSFKALTEMHNEKRLITLKWVFKIKFKDGVFERFKARLVGRGFTQQEGIDYDPEGTSSPVARNSTFMAVMAEATALGLLLKEFDVKCAYLLADLTEDVYCKVPYGMYVDPGTKCLKILKSLYGLKQSGYNWFSKLSSNLINIGFEQSIVDPCFFNYRKNGEICRICIWVDDGLVSVSSQELWEEIKGKIHADSPLSQAGPLKFLLGMAIEHDREHHKLKISQQSRIHALLESHGMSNCAGVTTPLPHGEKITSFECPRTPEEENYIAKACNFETYEKLVHYIRALIGAFGYLACWGRPDVRQATYYMARFQARPSKRHYQLVRRMLRYLKHTKDLCLTFDPKQSEMDLQTLRLPDKHKLYGMVDSNYTNAEDTKSTTGYIFWFYGCPIVCESKKQKSVSHSTTEAELVAASLATKRCIYLRRLLTLDFGVNLDATPIGEDNQGAIDISRGGGSQARMRHKRVGDSYVYQEFKINETIDLRYVKSEDNMSDMFTKALGPFTFTKLRNNLMRIPESN